MANVLMFMVDQLSMRWLEVADAIPTPHLDALRARGTTFSRCITSNPVCCPARATLATGLSSRGHGVLQNGYGLDPAIPTFMQGLQSAGWQTGVFGKLHLRPHFEGLHPDYRPYGFDVARITEDGRGGEWLDWIMAEHPEHLDDVLATIWATAIPEFSAYGPDQEDLAARIAAVRADYQWRTEADPHATPTQYALPFPEALSQTAWITREALAWIGERSPADPFFAQVSYVQPHGPFSPPARMLPCVNRDRLPQPAAAEWADDPDGPACFAAKGQAAIPADWRETRHYYFADIAHLDEQLGMVTAALDAQGLLADTTIIVLADHGEMLLDHGLRGKGEFHYDACIRVPLIMAGPGIAAGQQRSELVQLEDIAPTILEIAGVTPTASRSMGPYLQDTPSAGPGRSLLPLCRGEAASDEWRTVAYVESYNNIDSLSPIHWARTVTDEEWRYTWYPHGAGEQLFHLAEDPHEQQNRVRAPACQSQRERLRDMLLEHVVLQDFPHTPRSLFALGVH